MALIHCTACGEEERIRGERQPDDSIVVVCEVCGSTWSRDVRKVCRLCGSHRLEYAPRPLWERGRGAKRTPAGRFDSHTCLDCGGIDVTSPHARKPPTPPPGRRAGW